jgi:CelD/BcsL family acetyltransferase involved in cellulose biosynthesis
MNAPLAHSDTLVAQALPEIGGLRLRLHDNLASLEDLWRRLETHAVCTAYQSFDWCNIWVNRVGSSLAITPVIVVAENYFGEVLFILPLQKRKRFGLTIIEALSAPLGAYAFGLFHSDFYASKAQDWFEANLSTIIALLPKHDVFRLADIVEIVAGKSNPLRVGGSLVSANQCHVIDLHSDFQTFYEAKRPGRRRRYLRNRDAKLDAMGRVTFDLPTNDHDIRATMAVMFTDQEKRLAELGVHNVFSENEKQFFVDLALQEAATGRLMRPFRLTLDDTILAVISGVYFNKTFWALISSLADHDARKHSPGDYALRGAIKKMCEVGAEHYDFSVGDADYKSQWSDRQLQLYLILRARTLPGLALATVMLAKEKTKRIVKASPLLFGALATARRVFRGNGVSNSD